MGTITDSVNVYAPDSFNVVYTLVQGDSVNWGVDDEDEEYDDVTFIVNENDNYEGLTQVGINPTEGTPSSIQASNIIPKGNQMLSGYVKKEDSSKFNAS